MQILENKISRQTHHHLFIAAFIAIILSLLSIKALAEVTASLSRSEISENETVQLTVSIDETSLFGSDKPNIEILEKDFTILGSSNRSQSSWVNGKKSELSSWIYTLKAKQAGVITIPAIHIGKQSSQATVLKVSPIKTYTSNNNQTLDAVFISSELNKQESYVQEALILTIKFNDSLRLSNIGLSPLNIDGVTMIELSNISYQSNINQRPYLTYELQYALFPQKSGPLTIPAITVNGDKMTQGNGRRARYEPVRIQSEAIQANILPIPQNYPQDHWLPAQSIQLHESYSQALDNLQVGDAITRTIKLTGQGLSSAQLPELTLSPSSGLKIYPEAAQRNELDNTQDKSTVYSQLSQSFSLVATQAGKITLPEVKVAWFNTQTQQLEFAKLPSKTITVKANQDILAAQNFNSSQADAGSDTSAQQSSDAEQNTANTADKVSSQTEKPQLNNFSQLSAWLKSAIIGLLVLVFFLIFIILKLNRKLTQLESTSIQADGVSIHNKLTAKQLIHTADQGDLQVLRNQLIQFAQQQWPQAGIFSLSDLSSKLDPNSMNIIKQLDASLFQSQAAPTTHELIELINDLFTEKKESYSETKSDILKDLYPR